MKRIYKVLNVYENEKPCPVCGGKGVIVDGDGLGKYWLLCLGVAKTDCVETFPIPADVEVKKN